MGRGQQAKDLLYGPRRSGQIFTRLGFDQLINQLDKQAIPRWLYRDLPQIKMERVPAVYRHFSLDGEVHDYRFSGLSDKTTTVISLYQHRGTNYLSLDYDSELDDDISERPEHETYLLASVWRNLDQPLTIDFAVDDARSLASLFDRYPRSVFRIGGEVYGSDISEQERMSQMAASLADYPTFDDLLSESESLSQLLDKPRGYDMLAIASDNLSLYLEADLDQLAREMQWDAV